MGPTREQLNSAAGLREMYGPPDRAMLQEGGSEPLMYMAWFRAKRILFIRPDGKRQLFTGIQGRG